MITFVSTAICDNKDGSTYFQPKREVVADLTQARKAASRFWAGRVRHSKNELEKIVLFELAGLQARFHEKSIDGNWVAYTPPDELLSYQQSLIDLAGGLPNRNPPMPQVLEINGVIYERKS